MKVGKPFDWNPEKNRTLQQKRGICFENAVNAIESDQLLDNTPHHNLSKYPNQKIFTILIQNYTYIVPYVESKNKIFLKTIIPSRKAYKKYIASQE